MTGGLIMKGYWIGLWDSEGIIEVDAEVDPEYPPTMMCWEKKSGCITVPYSAIEGWTWFADRDEAVAAAKRMRVNKIRRLRNEVGRLKKMRIK